MHSFARYFHFAIVFGARSSASLMVRQLLPVTTISSHHLRVDSVVVLSSIGMQNRIVGPFRRSGSGQKFRLEAGQELLEYVL